MWLPVSISLSLPPFRIQIIYDIRFDSVLLCRWSISALVCCVAEGKTQEEVEAEDKEEEEEAKNIQRRLAANLSEEDYDLNLFQVGIDATLV